MHISTKLGRSIFFHSLLLMLFALPMASHAGGKPTLKVYFVSFHAISYANLTFEKLQKNPHYEIHFYQRHPFIEELEDAFADSASDGLEVHLTDLRLIAKMGENEAAVYAFNRDGTGKEIESGKTFKLKDEYKKAIEERVEQFHRVVDQMPALDVTGSD